MTATPATRHPCDAPGPAWGHCGNDATTAVRRVNGTAGIGYLCDHHRDEAKAWPRSNELIFTPLAPEVAP